jgi:predicted nucleic acid-binding protein
VSVYLDSSALVKLVVREPETDALRAYLRSADPVRVSSALARTEVVRAVAPYGAVEAARRLLGSLHDVVVTRALLDEAGDLAAELALRSLDAVHLATARSIADHLDVVITYDRRMLAGAQALGLRALAPT